MTQIYTPDGGLKGKVKRLASRFMAVTPLEYTLDHAIVSFSFDDFPKSAATNGARILQNYDWRATYYATGGFAGGHTHFGAMYDSSDLLRLRSSGHEIACHGFSHRDGTKISAEASDNECRANREFLRLAGHEGDISTYAFPYGETRPQTKPRLLQHYSVLRGVRAGINRTGSDRGLLNAVSLDGGQAGLAAGLNWIERVRARPGWLIFFGHDVCETPTPWGCTPRHLEQICEAVKSEGFTVLPVGEAITYIDGKADA